MRGFLITAGACVMLLMLAAARLIGQPGGFELTLVSVDGTKKVLGRLTASVFAPRLSPDGGRIAFETRDPIGPDGARLWIAGLANIPERRPLDSVAGPQNWAPIWSVDGQRLVFLVSGSRPDALYWRRADGSGSAEHLVDARSAEGWIGAGTQLRVLTLTGNRDYGISLFDMQSRTLMTLVDLPGSAQHSSAVSPDGRWIAYASNESGRYDVWLEPLPRSGQRYQVTRNGGGHPMWLPDGKSLYFDRGRQIFQVTVNTSATPSAGEPVPLPVKDFVQGELRRQFDLMPDGKQFLMLFPIAE